MKKIIEKILNIKVLGITAAILLAATVIFGVLWNSDSAEKQTAINELTSRNSELDTQLKDAQDSIEALEGETSELEKINKKQSAQIEELSDSVEEYEGRISEYVDQSETIEEQLRAIEELNGKLSTLQQQYDTLTAEHQGCQKTIESLNTQLQTARNNQSNTPANNNINAGGETVYWVTNGEVYHSTPDCPSLSRSKNIHSGTIAQSGKSRPCKNCY